MLSGLAFEAVSLGLAGSVLGECDAGLGSCQALTIVIGVKDKTRSEITKRHAILPLIRFALGILDCLKRRSSLFSRGNGRHELPPLVFDFWTRNEMI
jgi:hypothetical protein